MVRNVLKKGNVGARDGEFERILRLMTESDQINKSLRVAAGYGCVRLVEIHFTVCHLSQISIVGSEKQVGHQAPRTLAPPHLTPDDKKQDQQKSKMCTFV